MLVGAVGVAVGVAAGVLMDRQLGKSKSAPQTVFVTNTVVPKSSFKPIRDADAPPGQTFKTQGRVSFEEFPAALQSVLALEPHIIAWADAFARKENALFLGRGLHYPIALEGALKLKEISYIHAEAYPAGELKHGPLALVTKEMPVVTVAPNDTLIEKLKSNMQEVRARGGELYVFADSDSNIQSSEGIHVIRLPEHYGLLSPILHVVPLQLLAYHTALARGTDVDKPRNLAKSVTVE